MKRQFSKADIEKARLNIPQKTFKFENLGASLERINEAHKPKKRKGFDQALHDHWSGF